MRKLLTVLAVAGSFLAASTAAVANDYPVMRMKLAHFGPKAFVQSGIDEWWAKEVERRSGGKIKVQVFWAGSAGKPNEILKLVGSGVIDLGATPQAFYPNELPLIGAPNSVPNVFKTREAPIKISQELVDTNPYIKAELERNNVYPLFFHPMNSYYPLCTKPVKSLADFKGLKIRSFGSFQPPMWDSLGAIGVNVLPSDIYEGLQRGLLDCGFFSKDLYKSTKLYEVAKNLSTVGAGPVATWPIWVNMKKWNTEYPDNVKKLFIEVSREAQQRSLEAIIAAEQESLEFMKANGVVVHQFDDPKGYDKAIPDMLSVWQKNMKDKGLQKEADSVVTYWRKRQAELEPNQK